MPEEQKQCQTILVALQEEINSLINEVNKDLDGKFKDFKEDIQYEIASQITLLQRFSEYILTIQKRRYKNLAECLTLQLKFNSLKIAMNLLLLPKKESIVLAKNIRYNIEYFLKNKKPLGFIDNFFKKAVREWSAPTKVLLGLALAIPIYPVAIFLSSAAVRGASIVVTPEFWEGRGNTSNQNKSDPAIAPTSTIDTVGQNKQQKGSPSDIANTYNNLTLATVVALAGALGSIVSILIRLEQYRDTYYKGSSEPILVGFAKPLIGTAFGLFLFTMINSNILPVIKVPIPDGSTPQRNSDIRYYFFFSVAFLIGFSERLAKDIIERTEDTLLPDTVEEMKKEVKEASDDIQNTMPLVKEASETIINHQNHNL
jgi:hypothetical protein